MATAQDVRKSLKDQGFRLKENSDGSGFQALAPDGVGIAHVHTSSLSKEGTKAWTSVMKALKDIGWMGIDYVPHHVKKPTKPVPLEEMGLDIYSKEPPEDGDPNDRWVSLDEAAQAVGVTKGAIQQRIVKGRLASHKMPVQVSGGGGSIRTVQANHVNLAEVLKQGKGANAGAPHRQASEVRRRYSDDSVGRFKEATVELSRGARKVNEGIEQIIHAAASLEKEADGVLTELAELKKWKKDQLNWLEKGVSRA